MARKRTSISNKKVKSIINRDGSANCIYCGKIGKMQVFTGSTGRGSWLWIEHEIDHVIPINKDGSDDISNLVIACRSCNRKKKDKMGWEFGSQENDRP